MLKVHNQLVKLVARVCGVNDLQCYFCNIFLFILMFHSFTGDSNTSLISKAAQYGHLSMVKLLIDKGAKLNDGILFNTQHFQIIKYLLKRGANPKANYHLQNDNANDILHFNTETLGNTLLHKQCKRESLKNARYLVEHYHADVSAKNDKGQTPLHLACRDGNNLKLVKFLIKEQKADPAVTCNEGKTALHYAVENERGVSIFRYLIEDQKLHVEATDNKGRTALHLACTSFIWPNPKYLIEEHPEIIEAKDKWGKTALHYCFEMLHDSKTCYSYFQNDSINNEVFKILALLLVPKAETLKTVKNEVNGTNTDINPFLNKAISNRVDIAECLFNQDLEIIEDNFKVKYANLGRNLLLRNYLIFSCEEGWLDLTKFLFQEINKRQESFQLFKFDGSLLKTACHYKQSEVFKYLLEDEEAEDEAAEFLKEFPLHFACKWGSLEMVQCLVETKPLDVEDKNKEGQTPLHCALLNGSGQNTQYLIEEEKVCTDTNYTNGRSMFQVACMSGSLELVKYVIFLKSKPDVNAQDEIGMTALHLACEDYKNIKIVKFLITNMEADVNSVDKEGRTPLHVVCQSKWSSSLPITQFLVKSRANVLAKDKSGKIPLQIAKSDYKDFIFFLTAATKR
jgi:ankyrin repeat protein